MAQKRRGPGRRGRDEPDPVGCFGERELNPTASPVQNKFSSFQIAASKSAAPRLRPTRKTHWRPRQGRQAPIAVFDGKRGVGELIADSRGVAAFAIRAGRQIPLGIFRSRAAARRAVLAVSIMPDGANG